jgi:hypothetical protein
VGSAQRGRSHGPQDHISTILAACNQRLPANPGDPGRNAQDFARWRQALEAFGIFTLASSASEGFEQAIRTEISSELWARAHAQFGSNRANKVARGRFIAENSPCPQKVAELIRRVLCHLCKQGVDIRIPDDGGPT